MNQTEIKKKTRNIRGHTFSKERGGTPRTSGCSMTKTIYPETLDLNIVIGIRLYRKTAFPSLRRCLCQLSAPGTMIVLLIGNTLSQPLDH